MKNELIRSLQKFEVAENKEMKGKQGVTNHQQVIRIIKDYEHIIRSKKKRILNAAYRKGLLLKNFKNSNKLEQMLQKIEVSKSTVYFKLKLLKLLEKNPKIQYLSLSLNLFKDYVETFKEVCKEIGNQFKWNHDSIIFNG